MDKLKFCSIEDPRGGFPDRSASPGQPHPQAAHGRTAGGGRGRPLHDSVSAWASRMRKTLLRISVRLWRINIWVFHWMSVYRYLPYFFRAYQLFLPLCAPSASLYVGYLSGGTARRGGEDGRVFYDRKKVMVNTLFFCGGHKRRLLYFRPGRLRAGNLPAGQPDALCADWRRPHHST